MSPLRNLIEEIINRDDIKITTVHIEYFKTTQGDADPIILKFGHQSKLEDKSCQPKI
jgi:hypothetical protein